MAQKYYLGIDEGTTGVAAILFDENWNMAARGYREITQFYPRAGWVEHDAEEIWDSLRSAVQQAIMLVGAQPEEIRCLGLDHEGESVVVWDTATGRPVYPVIVWQDRRTSAVADALKQTHGAFIRERTGLTPDAYFSATKLQWVLDRVDPIRERSKSGQLMAGTMDAWFVWKMTGGRVHCTEASTASRTMLYNLHTQDWDDEILALLRIERKLLPEIRNSASHFGMTDADEFLGMRCEITGVMADQQAALLGQACTVPGSIKTTYGTGCFMLMHTGDRPVLSEHGILTTVAWRTNGKDEYALDGGSYVAGAATQWLRDGLKIISSAAETEEMARRAGDNGGIYFVPAFAGLAAPYWDSYARGTLIGVTGGTTREHIVRAALESTAYQVKDILDAMAKEAKMPIASMRCDGGATCNAFLMQFQADILGLPLEVPEISETTALGAAYMAAIGAKELSSSDEIAGHWRLHRYYEPHMSADERNTLFSQWHRAVERSLGWEKE